MSAALALLLAAGSTPICTDRPAKANAVCTVAAGRLQLESSVAGWSLTKVGAARAELVTVGATVLKFGLTDRSDLQLGVTPYARSAVKQLGQRSRSSGFGDVTVRYKQRLAADSSPLQVGMIAFVKLPTAARGLGNDKVEGGLAVPMSFATAGPITVTLGPELDLLADADGRGRHAAVVNVVNLSFPVAPRLTIAGELWTNVNFDPAGTAKQASADAALAYGVSDNLQLDGGVNLGLTRDTPDLELYAGLSIRFGKPSRR
jgi:hypothetical protein